MDDVNILRPEAAVFWSSSSIDCKKKWRVIIAAMRTGKSRPRRPFSRFRGRIFREMKLPSIYKLQFVSCILKNHRSCTKARPTPDIAVTIAIRGRCVNDDPIQR